MANIKKLGVLGILLLAYAGLAQATSISTYVFNDPSSLGYAESGQVVFTLTGTTLTAKVTNQIINPASVAYNISGLSFMFSGATLSNLGQYSPASATVTSNSPGGYTLDSTSNNPNWGTCAMGSTCISAISNTADYTILGAPDSNNAYSAANNSIVNNKGHTPFAFESATFTWNWSGLSEALPTLNNVQMMFGTTGTEWNTMTPLNPRTPVPVPEPSALAMFALGLLMLFLLGLTAGRRDAFTKRL